MFELHFTYKYYKCQHIKRENRQKNKKNIGRCKRNAGKTIGAGGFLKIPRPRLKNYGFASSLFGTSSV